MKVRDTPVNTAYIIAIFLSDYNGIDSEEEVSLEIDGLNV
jgi:hypothetical protein